jgi:hypothetical protein
MDFLGMGLCVAFIAFVRLPSLKVKTHLTERTYTSLAFAFVRLHSLQVSATH